MTVWFGASTSVVGRSSLAPAVLARAVAGADASVGAVVEVSVGWPASAG